MNYKQRPQTTFSRQRNSPSSILDKYKTKEKLANSEIPHRSPQYQRDLYSKLSKILEDEQNNEKEFENREILSSAELHDENQTEYHSFCIEFTKNASNYNKRFSAISKSAKSRSNYLKDQRKELENLEREAYRAEMKLPDPPIKDTSNESVFVNQKTDFDVYDAKLSLSLAQLQKSQT